MPDIRQVTRYRSYKPSRSSSNGLPSSVIAWRSGEIVPRQHWRYRSDDDERIGDVPAQEERQEEALEFVQRHRWGAVGT